MLLILSLHSAAGAAPTPAVAAASGLSNNSLNAIGLGLPAHGPHVEGLTDLTAVDSQPCVGRRHGAAIARDLSHLAGTEPRLELRRRALPPPVIA